MSNRTIYNVEYNIPRVDLSFAGRQNRSTDGILHITPGMTEPIEFRFGNQDGVPLNLAHFTLKIVFWKNYTLDVDERGMGQSKIIFAKQLEIVKPYEGGVIVKLDDDETYRLGQVSSRSIRWNIFAINEDKEVFPMQVSRSGSRDGTVIIDTASGIPYSELIRTA